MGAGTKGWQVLVLLVALVLVVVACSDDGSSGGKAAKGSTIRVPDGHKTIQAAVDAASPGDLIFVAPGTYEEAGDVEIKDLTIRGLDRGDDDGLPHLPAWRSKLINTYQRQRQ